MRYSRECLGYTQELEADGRCTFRFSAETPPCTLELPEDSDSVYFYASLCTVDNASRESLFAKALELNLYGLHTAHASIALDPETQHLMLYQTLPIAPCEYKDFCTTLHAFLNVIPKLQTTLNQ